MKKTYSKDILTVSMMLLITVCTQFASIIKSAVIASNFGVGLELDAFNFSNNISIFFWAFLSGGITSILIPAYLQKKSRKAIDTFLTVVFATTFLALAVTFIFRDAITGMLTNRDETFRFYVSNILLFVMLFQGTTAIHGVTAAYFQCVDKYIIPKLIQLFSNVLIVVVLITMKDFTIYEYVQALLAVSLLQLCVDVGVALRYGFRFRPCWSLKNGEFSELFRVFIPTLFSTGVYQLHFLIDSFITSNLQEGQLTFLSYANTIVNMVNALLVENLVVYLYPKLILGLKEKFEQGVQRLWSYSSLAHYILSLVVVGFFACGKEFIAIIYENGKFDETAVWGVYLGTCIYMLGQPNNIIRDLIYRFFCAMHDTKTTLYNSLLVSAANIVLSCILARFWGVYGVILGTVLAGALSLVMIIVRFHKKFRLDASFKTAVKEYVKTLFISVAAIVCVMVVKGHFDTQNDILNLLCYGSLSVVCYALFSVLFRNNIWKMASRG